MDQKQKLSFIVILLMHGVVSDSFHVHSVEIFTSNCDDCGIGVFGEISVKVGTICRFLKL